MAKVKCQHCLVGLTYLQSFLSIEKGEKVGGAGTAQGSPEVVFEGVSFTIPGQH